MGERKVDNSPGVFLDINVFFTIFPGTQSLQVLLLLPLLQSPLLIFTHPPLSKQKTPLPPTNREVYCHPCHLYPLCIGLRFGTTWPNSPWGPYPPDNAVIIKEDFPNTPFPLTTIVEISHENGAHNFRTLIKIIVPCLHRKMYNQLLRYRHCTRSRKLQLFTIGGYPTNQNT